MEDYEIPSIANARAWITLAHWWADKDNMEYVLIYVRRAALEINALEAGGRLYALAG